MGGERIDSENKIYVGGLSSETTTDSLERRFSQYGEVADCIVMMDKGAGRSRGFGFVTYRDTAGANAALGATHHVDGRDVSVKKATREGSAPPANSLVDKGDGNTFNAVKIFVGGLPSSCDQEKLTEYFSKFGRITDAVVMMDNQTQRHRGFGYCTFNDPASVEAAMREYSDNKIDGKWVEVKRCIPQDKMRDSDRVKSDRGRDGRDSRDGRDGRSSGGQPDYTQAWADYYARGGDPYAAYAAYGMGFPQHPAYGAYGYPAGAYGGYPMGGYPASAYGAYNPYGQDPRQAYGGVPPQMGSVPPQGALPAPEKSRDDRSRSRSRSRSRDRRRRRSSD